MRTEGERQRVGAGVVCVRTGEQGEKRDAGGGEMEGSRDVVDELVKEELGLLG